MDFSILAEAEKLREEIRSLAVEFDNSDNDLDIEEQLLAKKLELNVLKRNKSIKSKAVSALDLIKDVESRPTVPRYSTGVDALDAKLNGGIEIGSLVQLAGASFAGKTHLTIEILSSVAHREKVMFFNFEMGDRRIASRFARSLTTKESKQNMLIHNADRNLNHIVAEIKSAAKDGVKFFGIDSKMKIEVPDEKEEYKKFSKISATLSKLTQESEIIIFLINQISEDDDKNGRLSFKGSGDQLYDTDLALFYLIDKKDLSTRKLVCRKNRQDENNFVLDLRLDANNRTVGKEVVTVFQDENDRHISSPMI